MEPPALRPSSMIPLFDITFLRYKLSPEECIAGNRKNVLLILSALFPIVNPLGGSPVFLALKADYPTAARRGLARQVAVNSFLLLIASFLVGTHTLNLFGISMPVVQVGGGLLVISNGWATETKGRARPRARGVKKVASQDVFRNAFSQNGAPEAKVERDVRCRLSRPGDSQTKLGLASLRPTRGFRISRF